MIAKAKCPDHAVATVAGGRRQASGTWTNALPNIAFLLVLARLLQSLATMVKNEKVGQQAVANPTSHKRLRQSLRTRKDKANTCVSYFTWKLRRPVENTFELHGT